MYRGPCLAFEHGEQCVSGDEGFFLAEDTDQVAVADENVLNIAYFSTARGK